MSTAPKHYITPEEYLEQERRANCWMLTFHRDLHSSVALSSVPVKLRLADVYEDVQFT